MTLRLKSRKLVKLIGILTASLLSVIIVGWSVLGTVWTRWDYKILDFYGQLAVQFGYGPPKSSQIVYVTIDDESYQSFGKNTLDRAFLAQVNDALARYGAEAVLYDIIFAYPSTPHTDELFRNSIQRHHAVYLPIGLGHSNQPASFRWGQGSTFDRLRTDYLKQPVERGASRPLYATQALMQVDDFAQAASNSGHITLFSDSDGTYRHFPILLKLDSQYFPALTFASFLDYTQVPFEDVVVDWGRTMTIPALPDSFLDQDVIIPIDQQGKTFVPYVGVWGEDFATIKSHVFLQYSKNANLQGNLLQFFEGKFVIVADISTGTDIGRTPLEDHAPKVAAHAAFLNGLLTNRFYRTWSFWPVVGVICGLGGLLVLSALPRSSWVLYVTGGLITLGLLLFTWFEFTQFTLFPIFTTGTSFLVVFFGLVVGLETQIAKDQAFIRDAFAKYVPEKVVSELLLHPELLHLGGEERILTVLFSDVENFTSIAENMSPADLVSLLNEYLSEMTDIILVHGGIIDKYEGDAIMAEFGAPLPLSQHADLAVRAGLAMQRRLQELGRVWEKRGLPALQCRVGINTGPMIVGNMGSAQVFDYTVMGDAVNLASRLEGANKLYRTYLMISEFTYEHLSPDVFRTRVLDVIKVKGKSRAVKVFEVYGETSDEIRPKDELYYQTYHAAFEAYLSRNFAAAHKQFMTALSLRPNDVVSQTMLERMTALDPHDLPDDWDGSVALVSK